MFVAVTSAVPAFLCLLEMVGAAGFEPAASWSQTKRAAKLRHAPKAGMLPCH
jgi:hypothetical protein